MGYASAQRVPRQKGAVLLVLMLILTVGIASILLSGLKTRDAEQVRREQSAAVLEQARQALLAWSLTRDGTIGSGNCSPNSSTNGRACAPLELPCPANPNETAIDLVGTSITTCNTASNLASRIGWLPWKTLGIPKLVDAYGEPLWYAVDLGFVVRKQDTEPRKLNSDSLSALQLYRDSAEISANSENPAALIFAPGPPLAGQQRQSPLSVAQYLEGGASYSNATLGGPYLSSALSETFNDQVAVVTGFELIDGAQARVASEIANQLLQYWTAYQLAYPSLAVLKSSLQIAAWHVPQKATAAAAACAPIWNATTNYQTGDVVSETPGGSDNWKNYTAKSSVIGVAPQGNPGIWGSGSKCTAPSSTPTPAPSVTPTPVSTATPSPSVIPEPYPYPADIIGDSTCRDNTLYTSNTGCRSKANLCAGILPRAADDWTGQGKLPAAISNQLPTWFSQNIWHRAIFYAVKQGAVCNASFVIDTVNEPLIDAIYILPGAARSARANNLLIAANASTDLRLYLDDSSNQTQWLAPSNRQFVTPTCSSNDLMYTCQQGVCSPRSRIC